MTPLETRAAEIFNAGWPNRRAAAIAAATSKITGECREDRRLAALHQLVLIDWVAAAAQADREHKAQTARRIAQNLSFSSGTPAGEEAGRSPVPASSNFMPGLDRFLQNLITGKAA